MRPKQVYLGLTGDIMMMMYRSGLMERFPKETETGAVSYKIFPTQRDVQS